MGGILPGDWIVGKGAGCHIVRSSASHAVLDALRPLSQVEQKAGHTFIISTHSVGMYRSDL
ncbi:hypothetical protein DND90_04780 [Pseudomonas syringae pv. maculicola]|nr:hypothetical protein DND90_04780 [Pseudomonas syringae pv. maculicola]